MSRKGKYGLWVENLVRSAGDFEYYREQSEIVSKIAQSHLSTLAETIEGRDKLRRLRWPNFPPLGTERVRHRDAIERLLAMVDFVLQVEFALGLPADGWQEELFFVPPYWQHYVFVTKGELA